MSLKGDFVVGGAAYPFYDGHYIKNGQAIRIYDGYYIKNGVATKIYQSYDAQAQSISGTIYADGSIAYPESSGSAAAVYNWFHLHFDTPIAYTSGQAIMHISNITSHYKRGSVSAWGLPYWLSTTINDGNEIATTTSSVSTIYETGVTENLDFVAKSTGSSSDFYFGIQTPSLGTPQTWKSEAPTGCLTLGGKQLLSIDLI